MRKLCWKRRSGEISRRRTTGLGNVCKWKMNEIRDFQATKKKLVSF